MQSVNLSQKYNELSSGGRCLTPEEIALAHKVFWDNLSYDAIRIHDGVDPIYSASVGVSEIIAIAPNNNIYYEPQHYCENFATASEYVQSIFIHELGHVWQYQHGVDTMSEHVHNLDDYPVHRDAYHFTVQDVQRGFQYLNTEQQASFFQHFFRLQNMVYEVKVKYADVEVMGFSYGSALSVVQQAFRNDPVLISRQGGEVVADIGADEVNHFIKVSL